MKDHTTPLYTFYGLVIYLPHTLVSLSSSHLGIIRPYPPFVYLCLISIASPVSYLSPKHLSPCLALSHISLYALHTPHLMCVDSRYNMQPDGIIGTKATLPIFFASSSHHPSVGGVAIAIVIVTTLPPSEYRYVTGGHRCHDHHWAEEKEL